MATFSTQVTASSFSTLGYVTVTWTNAGKSVNFYAWRVYRAVEDDVDDEVWSDWELISSTIIDSPTYTFFDYGAPANRRVRYLVVEVTQGVGGALTEGSLADNWRYVITSDDKYWLLHPTDSTLTMKIPLTKADAFTTEREEESFVLLGRGRKVDQGEVIGITGTLTIDFRSRVEYKKLVRLWLDGSWVFLRNPFGDIYRVSIKEPQVAREAGVGTQEFVTVTLPYEEVLSD